MVPAGTRYQVGTAAAANGLGGAVFKFNCWKEPRLTTTGQAFHCHRVARIELSHEQIRAKALSIFAAAGVSDKYTFLPPSQIIGRMRQEGWAQVEAQQQAVRVEGRMGLQKHVIRCQRRDQIARPGDYTPEIALNGAG
jgi:hypothetical protein